MATAITLVEPAQNKFLADLEKRSKRAIHFFRLMANRPEVLKNFVPLYGSIMGPGPVNQRTKELVYLTVSYTNKCAYCTAAHTASGRKAGVTEDEMRSLKAGQDGSFSAPERAAIQYARELTRTADAGQARDGPNRFNNWLRLLPEQ